MNRRMIILAAAILSFGVKAKGEESPSIDKELLHGFGELNEYTLVSVDEMLVNDFTRVRRYILDADPLGRLLLVQTLEGSEIRKRSLYSAERLIINVAQHADLAAVQRSLIKSGIDCEHPFEHSLFLYAKVATVETAEELYGLAERARAAVGVREPKGVNVHISYLTSDLFSIGV